MSDGGLDERGGRCIVDCGIQRALCAERAQAPLVVHAERACEHRAPACVLEVAVDVTPLEGCDRSREANTRLPLVVKVEASTGNVAKTPRARPWASTSRATRSILHARSSSMFCPVCPRYRSISLRSIARGSSVPPSVTTRGPASAPGSSRMFDDVASVCVSTASGSLDEGHS